VESLEIEGKIDRVMDKIEWFVFGAGLVFSVFTLPPIGFILNLKDILKGG
jgi:hypothetical protein